VVANLTVEGQPVTHLGDDFAAAVRNATRPLLSGPGWRGQVVVTWSPYRGAHLGGELTVGPSPPPDVDVHAARLQVPSNLPTARERAAEVAPDGFDAVADVVARELVEGLFPPDRTRARLLGSYPDARLTAHRYQSFADSYGVSVEEALANRNVARANRRLRAAVADSVASDVRKRFETPTEAAEAVRLRSVTITVRTWST